MNNLYKDNKLKIKEVDDDFYMYRIQVGTQGSILRAESHDAKTIIRLEDKIHNIEFIKMDKGIEIRCKGDFELTTLYFALENIMKILSKEVWKTYD